jgi:hypothetical protein
VHLDAAEGNRGGDILLADSTIFTTLFGGTESLEHFWRNMANFESKSRGIGQHSRR